MVSDQARSIVYKVRAWAPDSSKVKTGLNTLRKSHQGFRLAAGLSYVVWVRWTPHPVIVTIRDNGNYIRVFL